MKTTFILLSAVLTFGVSLYANTATVVMTSNNGSTVSAFPSTYGNNSTVFQGEEISPYEGTIGGVAAVLFCDDYVDKITPGQSYTGVNITAVNASNTDTGYTNNNTAGSVANMRDGTANISSGYPVGTTLYEEMAWLATQMMTSGRTVGDEESIQEAIWSLSENPSTSGSPTVDASGETQTYSQWVTDAKDYYDTTNGSYVTPNYNNWLVLTVPADAGVTIGSGGVQELLAYTGQVPTKTPEPASFVLIGSGLLMGAVFGRRRRARKQ